MYNDLQKNMDPKLLSVGGIRWGNLFGVYVTREGMPPYAEKNTFKNNIDNR